VSDGTHTTARTFEVLVRAVNDPPTLSGIVNAGVNEDTATGEIVFVVGDLETALGDLTVSASAADPALVPPSNITFGGSGANRWLRIMPAPNKFGGTTITYGVSDGEATTERSFPFTVISRNDAPTANMERMRMLAYDYPVNTIRVRGSRCGIIGHCLREDGFADSAHAFDCR
jgi:hypothetical protein